MEFFKLFKLNFFYYFIKKEKKWKRIFLLDRINIICYSERRNESSGEILLKVWNHGK